MKKIYLLLLASFLFTSTVSAKEVYVALGDSLAAGQTPYAQIDTGYTDFIAMQLMRSGQLQSFTKQLAFPGYTVGDVLERVQTEEAQHLLKNATLITISAGANNLLPLVSHNPQKGTISFSQLTANFALNKARKDYVELLQLINKLAPNADVYVMGYYFPYVSVHEEQLVGVTEQLDVLNDILANVASAYDAEFINVSFGNETSRYLSNVADVHPNMEGYMVMANAFLQERGLMQLNASQLPEPNPLTFEQILQMQQQNQEQQQLELEQQSIQPEIEQPQQQTVEEPVAQKINKKSLISHYFERFKRLFLL